MIGRLKPCRGENMQFVTTLSIDGRSVIVRDGPMQERTSEKYGHIHQGYNEYIVPTNEKAEVRYLLKVVRKPNYS